MTPPAFAHRDIRTAADGKPLWWGRMAAELGAPVAGEPAYVGDATELAERMVRVAAVSVRQFDMANPEDNAHYCQIMSRAFNGWYQVYDRHRLPDGKVELHWVEWTYRDLGTADAADWRPR